MKRTLPFVLLVGVLVLGACNGTSPTGARIVPQAREAPLVQTGGTEVGKRALYVASATPYFFNVYRLPLHDGEGPALTKRGVNEPVPLAVDAGHLYVGSFDDGTIFTYALPFPLESSNAAVTAVADGPFFKPLSGNRVPRASPLESSLGIPSGLGTLSGLAVSGRYLYVAGSAAHDDEVIAYRLPLRAGEPPSASLGGFSIVDFLSLAAQNHTLYVASTTAGTVSAYSLPLTKNESPQYTIDTVRQDNGASGVAVDSRSRRLYVSLYQVGVVDEYGLPYHAGERAKVLDVRAETGGSPYGIAIGQDHLFVTAGNVLAFRLPFRSPMTPDAVIPFNGLAAGVAAGK